jgi:hypothetical protein
MEPCAAGAIDKRAGAAAEIDQPAGADSAPQSPQESVIPRVGQQSALPLGRGDVVRRVQAFEIDPSRGEHRTASRAPPQIEWLDLGSAAPADSATGLCVHNSPDML